MIRAQKKLIFKSVEELWYSCHMKLKERIAKSLYLTTVWPYSILEDQTNCLLVRPVDKPDSQAILVSMDRVTQCPKELPDISWLGPKPKRPKARKVRQSVTTKKNNTRNIP